MNPLPITQTGYNKLRAKIAELNKEFQKLPKIIQAARSKGDLKENAEYHAAREKQGMLNAQLSKLNTHLSTARVIDPANLPQDIVTFGKKVTLTKLPAKLTVTYYIVGPAEVEFFEQGLSIVSQLAKGILTKRAGDEVTINAPAGKQRYKIEKLTC